jgi:hypothetical protein
MTKRGKVIQTIQAYRCSNGHYATATDRSLWDTAFIEHVVYVYLKYLSLTRPLRSYVKNTKKIY